MRVDVPLDEPRQAQVDPGDLGERTDRLGEGAGPGLVEARLAHSCAHAVER